MMEREANQGEFDVLNSPYSGSGHMWVCVVNWCIPLIRNRENAGLALSGPLESKLYGP